ncbi:MAG TPA: helicase-associated domain-containing protein [Intrasporangium sp.]|uniref:helicase-associated domain-containing protein n=1 Tax=Intrasporangium sp. TaxID=1925024 RepID=UPI002D7818FB|nr:helicase-associated domain-containing protein [Intrasporangium sp.]HET7398787.1 helicase-associated domain-containing protein [Intrasporangium sp.]
MRTPSRSLADDIRGRSDEELGRLVLARPDLARPAPADLTSLAARASTRSSVQRAVESLDRGHLEVLEALVVAGEQPDPGRVVELLGAADEEDVVTAYVEDLWRVGLLWRGPEGHHVVRTVPEVLGPHVAGLGPPARELRGSTGAAHEDAAALGDIIEAAPEASRALLAKMAWGPPVGVLPGGGPGSTTARWLLDHHLLVPVSTDRVALPREVGLVLRGGRVHRETHLRPRDLATRQVPREVVDAAAGGQASDLLGRVDELAAAWGTDPPRVLRAGGLAVRDLGRLAHQLGLDGDHAAFVAEVAYAAGLVGDDGEVVPVWAPTSEVDEWSTSEAGHRWATLATAWLTTTRAPHLVGRRASGSAAANALGPDVQWPAIRAIRGEVLTELASLPEGTAVAAAELAERLLWRRPLRSGSVLATAAEAVLREAEWLGVTGRGALSAAGRVLVAAGRGADRDALAAAMSAHLPTPVDHILVQADLTAVAPGPLEGSLSSFLRLAADVESRGGATVYRFTPESVRRALDAGWSAAELIETVRRSSRTPLPQPLDYLVRDVARRHGQTRVGAVAAYVRSDDEAVLDTMLASRDLAMLQLRRIAPTVLVSPTEPAVLVDVLREGGFAPVHEGRDGSVVVAGPPRRRAGGRRRVAPPTVSPVDETVTAQLVAGLRAAEASAAERRAEEDARPGPRIPASDPVVTLALLREAAADRHGVWIGVTDHLGATTRHLIHPRRVEAGRVWATDAAGHERSYSVHRITGATLDTP